METAAGFANDNIPIELIGWLSSLEGRTRLRSHRRVRIELRHRHEHRSARALSLSRLGFRPVVAGAVEDLGLKRFNRDDHHAQARRHHAVRHPTDRLAGAWRPCSVDRHVRACHARFARLRAEAEPVSANMH
jgi:hypothetical protein